MDKRKRDITAFERSSNFHIFYRVQWEDHDGELSQMARCLYPLIPLTQIFREYNSISIYFKTFKLQT